MARPKPNHQSLRNHHRCHLPHHRFHTHSRRSPKMRDPPNVGIIHQNLELHDFDEIPRQDVEHDIFEFTRHELSKWEQKVEIVNWILRSMRVRLVKVVVMRWW